MRRSQSDETTAKRTMNPAEVRYLLSVPSCLSCGVMLRTSSVLSRREESQALRCWIASQFFRSKFRAC